MHDAIYQLHSPAGKLREIKLYDFENKLENIEDIESVAEFISSEHYNKACEDNIEKDRILIDIDDPDYKVREVLYTKIIIYGGYGFLRINHTKNDVMKLIIIILLAFFLYTILEWLLYKKGCLSENKQLWSSPYTFIWGSILLLLLFFVIPGEYKPWGDILYIKEAFMHIILWILGLVVYYSLNSKSLFRSPASLSWDRKEFYYFCFFNPIIEETLFRGIILMNLLNKFPVIKYEELFVIISSLLFALFHINYEYNFKLSKDYIGGTFVIFILGNAIGFLVLLTRSLWMSILMHILLNLTGALYLNLLKLKSASKN